MEEKFEKFIEACKVLNQMGITPALFGSMALYRIVGEKEKIGDIDILIPDEYLINKFDKLKGALIQSGFVQDTTFPHQFKFQGEEIEFAPLQLTITQMHTDLSLLKTVDESGIKYIELTADNLLNFHKFARNEREEKLKKINRRINYLEEYLK